MGALRDLAAAPTTNGAIRGLTATVTTLQPQLRFLGPYITVCNYWNIFWTFAAEHFTAPARRPAARSARCSTAATARTTASSSTLGANEYATGRGVVEPGGVKQYVHTNTAGGNAIDRTTARRTARRASRATRTAPTSFDDTQDKFYRRAVVDQLNGLLDDRDKGSTFAKFDENGRGVGRNRPRVPEGQTFTDLPGGRAALTEHDERILRSRGQRP